jgi:predicted RNase H-like HicB family nuclease
VQSASYIYWQQDDAWLGFFEEYPDYWTQGASLDDLKEHLKGLYSDLQSGQIPGIRCAD